MKVKHIKNKLNVLNPEIDVSVDNKGIYVPDLKQYIFLNDRDDEDGGIDVDREGNVTSYPAEKEEEKEQESEENPNEESENEERESEEETKRESRKKGKRELENEK